MQHPQQAVTVSPPKVCRATIAATYQQIKSAIRLTPVIDVRVPGVALPVTLKLECLQHTGSFKPRGAFANLMEATAPAAGVAAASGGNHGAAVAYAAKVLGLPARIFVPVLTPPAKVDRIKSYGAEVVATGDNYAQALAGCEEYLDQSGALAVHAYDSHATLNGQGTIGLELENQAPGLDTVLVAIGGGGLIGGIAAWCHGGPKVIGIEPETCATLHAALAAGHPVDILPSGLAVDSLGASRAGALMFPIARQAIASVALVGDRDIAAAQAWLWNDLRLVTEPGGAAAFAALLCGAYRAEPDERVGVIMCGANTDLEAFARTVSRGS